MFFGLNRKVALPTGSKQREQYERHVAQGCKGSVKVEDVGNHLACTVEHSRERFLGTDSCDVTLNSLFRGSSIFAAPSRGRDDDVMFLRCRNWGWFWELWTQSSSILFGCVRVSCV